MHEALGEFLRIVGAAGLRGEVFHLKALGRPNWHLMDGAISLIEEARSAGLPVTADVYPYTAGSSGLTSIIPDRYHEGGAAALYDRLGAPEVRAAIRAELSSSGRWSRVSEAENVLILRAAAEENRKWQGRTLAEVAAARGTDPLEAAMDLIASDRSRIQVAYFSMSEENLRAALRRPWVGISSDSASMAPEAACECAATGSGLCGLKPSLVPARLRERTIEERSRPGGSGICRRSVPYGGHIASVAGHGGVADDPAVFG